MKRQNEPIAEPILLSIQEVTRSLRLGRTKVYKLIATSGLPTVRFGRSIRVPVTKLQEWIDQRGEQHIA